MPHIHTKPGQHDFTASAYIIRLDGDEPRVLLHKHKKIGRYYQFGGHVELHETPWQAVIHEIEEESGYLISQLQLLQPKDRVMALPTETIHPQPIAIVTHSFDDQHNHTDIEYAFVTHEEPALKVGEAESDDFVLLRLDELTQGKYDVPPDIIKLCAHVFEIILPNWEQVTPPSN